MHSFRIGFAISLSLLLLGALPSQAGYQGAQRITWEPDPDYRPEHRSPRVPDDYDEEDEDEGPPGYSQEEDGEEQDQFPAPSPPPGSYRLPAFQPSWGLSRSIYERAQWAMRQFGGSFSNRRFVVVIDFSKPSSQRRFFLFNIQNGSVERLRVAHGKGSDPRRSGYARSFSNRPQSMQSSLGAYRTLGTDYGKHGLLLRLSGLEGTNSNAFRRAIVMHGARYVSEAQGRAGRSWGCPALDQRISSSVINRIRGGALLLIGR